MLESWQAPSLEFPHIRRDEFCDFHRACPDGLILAFAIVPLRASSLTGKLSAYAESGLAALFVVANLSELIF